MPWWGRVILIAAGIGLAAINGLANFHGPGDIVGVILIVIGVFSLRRKRHVQDWRP